MYSIYTCKTKAIELLVDFTEAIDLFVDFTI